MNLGDWARTPIRWIVPDRALRWASFGYEPRPWLFRYHGGYLDGRTMIHLGAAARTVLPVYRDGFLEDQVYEHRFSEPGVVDAFCVSEPVEVLDRAFPE